MIYFNKFKNSDIRFLSSSQTNLSNKNNVLKEENKDSFNSKNQQTTDKSKKNTLIYVIGGLLVGAGIIAAIIKHKSGNIKNKVNTVIDSGTNNSNNVVNKSRSTRSNTANSSTRNNKISETTSQETINPNQNISKESSIDSNVNNINRNENPETTVQEITNSQNVNKPREANSDISQNNVKVQDKPENTTQEILNTDQNINKSKKTLLDNNQINVKAEENPEEAIQKLITRYNNISTTGQDINATIEEKNKIINQIASIRANNINETCKTVDDFTQKQISQTNNLLEKAKDVLNRK